MKKLFVLFLALLVLLPLTAQIRGNNIVVTVEPDHQDWRYNVGETAKFVVEVRRSGTLLENVSIDYAAGPEMYQTEKKQALKSGWIYKKSMLLNCQMQRLLNLIADTMFIIISRSR